MVQGLRLTIVPAVHNELPKLCRIVWGSSSQGCADPEETLVYAYCERHAERGIKGISNEVPAWEMASQFAKPHPSGMF